MSKGRLEAFSDGGFAILITIMVLDIKVPQGADVNALRPLIPVVLSFVFLGIYWNNHHHLLQAVRHVNGRILWANLHLLFWLSLILKECGLKVEDCGDEPEIFLYMDDGIFSGIRVRNDLMEWINSDAPSTATVRVVVIAYHNNGQEYAKRYLQQVAHAAKKKIKTDWWRIIQLEDRKEFIDTSEVLRPASLPEDDLTTGYVKMLKDSGYPPILRKAGAMGDSRIFSSEVGRDLLEQQLLQAGLQIREECPYLKENHRPLGYMVLKTMGFGALLVTFRNCPNNCPLAFWADDPWYPLFPRKIN